jgi:DNA-binding response OmpR family regulator
MERVLLAEDDDEMRCTLARELSRAGYAVHTARNGMEALIFVTLLEFDVTVFDVRMPACTGLEVLARLRERGSCVPCVLISGFADGMEGVAERYGAVVLSKPFPMTALWAAIRDARHARAGGDAALTDPGAHGEVTKT